MACVPSCCSGDLGYGVHGTLFIEICQVPRTSGGRGEEEKEEREARAGDEDEGTSCCRCPRGFSRELNEVDGYILKKYMNDA